MCRFKPRQQQLMRWSVKWHHWITSNTNQMLCFRSCTKPKYGNKKLPTVQLRKTSRKVLFHKYLYKMTSLCHFTHWHVSGLDTNVTWSVFDQRNLVQSNRTKEENNFFAEKNITYFWQPITLKCRFLRHFFYVYSQSVISLDQLWPKNWFICSHHSVKTPANVES